MCVSDCGCGTEREGDIPITFFLCFSGPRQSTWRISRRPVLSAPQFATQKVSTLPRRTRLPMPASSPAARAIPPAYISRVSRSHHASHARRAAAASASSSSVAAAAQPAVEKEALKRQILRLSALTDRGQLLFQQAAYAPLDKYNAAGPRTSYLHTLSLTVYSRRVDPSLRASRWERAVTRYAPKNT